MPSIIMPLSDEIYWLDNSVLDFTVHLPPGIIKHTFKAAYSFVLLEK